MGRRISKIIQLGWTLLIIFFVVYYLKKNFGNLQEFDYELELSWLIYAVVLEMAKRLIGGIRWTLVFTQNRGHIGWMEIIDHLHTFFVSNLASYLPGSV